MGAHKVLANTHKHLWGQSKESHVRAPLRHAGAPLRPVHVGKVAGRADESRLPPPPSPPAESREGKCLTWCLLVSQEPNREEALLQQLKEKDELILRLQSELVSATCLCDTS